MLHFSQGKKGSQKGLTEGVLGSGVRRVPYFSCGCDVIRNKKNGPKFFRPKFLRGRPRGMSVPKCLFFQDLEGLTEVFGRMSAGTSGRRLKRLWADFSFLRKGT